MKGVVVLAVCLGLAFFCWSMWFSGELVRDQGQWIPVAFGAPSPKTIQMHVAVAPGLPLADPPETDERLRPKWDEWIDKHFQLFAADGQRLALQKIGTSGMFTGEVAAGAPEFALWAALNKGESYRCEYIPNTRKGTRYVYLFVAPEEPEKVALRGFNPAGEGP